MWTRQTQTNLGALTQTIPLAIIHFPWLPITGSFLSFRTTLKSHILNPLLTIQTTMDTQTLTIMWSYFNFLGSIQYRLKFVVYYVSPSPEYRFHDRKDLVYFFPAVFTIPSTMPGTRQVLNIALNLVRWSSSHCTPYLVYSTVSLTTLLVLQKQHCTHLYIPSS